MPTKKTWVWILVTVASVCIVALLVMAGAGVVFVSRHVRATMSTSANAVKEFDAAKAPFKDAVPIFDLESRDHPRMTRDLESLPTSNVKASDLWILAWDPDATPREGKLVRISLPFWLLRLGRRKVDVFRGGTDGFDLERLNLDVRDLERVGPLMLVDHSLPHGERVLVWTQ
jgi:hypothetical protein